VFFRDTSFVNSKLSPPFCNQKTQFPNSPRPIVCPSQYDAPLFCQRQSRHQLRTFPSLALRTLLDYWPFGGKAICVSLGYVSFSALGFPPPADLKDNLREPPSKFYWISFRFSSRFSSSSGSNSITTLKNPPIAFEDKNRFLSPPLFLPRLPRKVLRPPPAPFPL